jgi:DDE superfamily endonuclease
VPVPDTVIVSCFTDFLQVFDPCFTAPSFRTFTVLCSGWVLAMGRHTVTGMVRAANAVGWKHIRTFHRFFAKGSWTTDEIGLVLVRLVDQLVAHGAAMVVAVDDTLGRHTGKKIAAASMHRDPLLSTGRRPFFHWGHVWVTAGINICAFGKTWCVPVLVRLYRSRKRCKRDKRAYRKTTELAAEMIGLLAQVLPHRKILVVGDAAYTNSSVIKRRPSNVTVIGRSRLDAALFSPPPARRRGQMGRPRVRGTRLPSPAKQIERRGVRWSKVQVTVYGKTVTVSVFVIDALWYVAAGSELVRLVVVRDFPGHERDDVFVSTDPTMAATTIIERFSERWSLEVTFHDTKGKLGFEEPQNRTERAVERTAPMALWLYTLVVLWYIRAGHRLRSAKSPVMPWYRHKAGPSFSDMLATLRRASWADRLLNPCASAPTLRKQIAPLLHCLEAAA